MRLVYVMLDKIGLIIFTHAPAKGATYTKNPFIFKFGISTHAPA